MSKTRKYVTIQKGDDFCTIAQNLTNEGFSTNTGIYFLRNKKNNRVYIGSAVSCARRKAEHRKLLISGRHPNVFLKYDFQKYSLSFDSLFAFEMKELVFDKNILLVREQVYLDLFFDKQRQCYNLAPKAGSAFGVKWSESSKKRQSDKRKGPRNPMWGKTHSQETCVLLAQQQQKKVQQFSFEGVPLEIYNSITEAAKSVGVSRQMIGHCCNKNRKTSKGFIWKFYNE